jgi:hypothetical protein
VNGDACADLLGRTGDGVLRLYAGGCDGTLEDGVVIGHGWDMHTMVFGRDFDGDGCGDVIARDTKGDLFLYRSTCGGALQAPQYLGYGWNAFAALF